MGPDTGPATAEPKLLEAGDFFIFPRRAQENNAHGIDDLQRIADLSQNDTYKSMCNVIMPCPLKLCALQLCATGIN